MTGWGDGTLSLAVALSVSLPLREPWPGWIAILVLCSWTWSLCNDEGYIPVIQSSSFVQFWCGSPNLQNMDLETFPVPDFCKIHRRNTCIWKSCFLNWLKSYYSKGKDKQRSGSWTWGALNPPAESVKHGGLSHHLALWVHVLWDERPQSCISNISYQETRVLRHILQTFTLISQKV